MTAEEAREISRQSDQPEMLVEVLFGDVSKVIEWAAKGGNYQCRIDFLMLVETNVVLNNYVRGRKSVLLDLYERFMKRMEEEGYKTSKVIDDVYLVSWAEEDVPDEPENPDDPEELVDPDTPQNPDDAGDADDSDTGDVTDPDETNQEDNNGVQP